MVVSKHASIGFRGACRLRNRLSGDDEELEQSTKTTVLLDALLGTNRDQ